MQILAKAEFLNPGGSVKDRVALHIIQDAFAGGLLQEGGLITEGTAGSTGLHITAALHAWMGRLCCTCSSQLHCTLWVVLHGPLHLLICMACDSDLVHCWHH